MILLGTPNVILDRAFVASEVQVAAPAPTSGAGAQHGDQWPGEPDLPFVLEAKCEANAKPHGRHDQYLDSLFVADAVMNLGAGFAAGQLADPQFASLLPLGLPR